uniref:Peptidase S1 domain-containing protein n=1 Tax=Macrostomum lignano TaxID=282301 RepID=A0A1I8JG62_9PLAT
MAAKLLLVVAVFIVVHSTEASVPSYRARSRPAVCYKSLSIDAGKPRRSDDDSERLAGKRIVNGRESRHGEWPWMVSLRSRYLEFYDFVATTAGVPHKNHICGGALISPRWVLSARHCFKDGTVEYRKDGSPNAEPYHQDMALLKLSRPVPLSEYAQPACLEDPGQAAKPGDSCFIAGWGSVITGARVHSSVLRHAKVDVLNPVHCQTYNWMEPGSFKPGELCAAGLSHATDACQFDSGGPLMCYNSARKGWFLSGIISRGVGCANEYFPGIYANVTANIDWIEKTMASE